MWQPVKGIKTLLVEFCIYLESLHMNLQLVLFHISSVEPQCERKSCLAQQFHCEAITGVESSYQLASVNFYLSTSLPFSYSFCLRSLLHSLHEPSFTSSTHLHSYLSVSLTLFLSSSVCLCRSVCLYPLTLSSLPSQHCSSWLPESQPPLSIPHSSNSHPLNKVRKGGRDRY